MYDMSVTELSETVESLEKTTKELRILMSMLDNDITEKATLTFEQIQEISFELNLFREILRDKMDGTRVNF